MLWIDTETKSRVLPVKLHSNQKSMESKYKIKVICGFREDQEYTIDAKEAHKAYYLFNQATVNPDMRGNFAGGLSLMAKDIRRIVPDYIATMGWNPSHRITGADWNDIHKAGIMAKMQNIMVTAQHVGKIGDTADLAVPLHELMKSKYAQIEAGSPYAQKVLGQK